MKRVHGDTRVGCETRDFWIRRIYSVMLVEEIRIYSFFFFFLFKKKTVENDRRLIIGELDIGKVITGLC